MSIFSYFGHGSAPAPTYPSDLVTLNNGDSLRITFFKHASFALEVAEKYHIYIDPVKEYADYARLPKADLVLVTHSHYDHFDRAAIDAVSTRHTDIVCDHTTAEGFDTNCLVLTPGKTATPRDYIRIEAVAAYNTTEGHTDFHPKAREDCGYVVTVGDTRIYIAGDTEPTEEMFSLRDIDIAFLPVNQPYTMTVEQAVTAVKQLRPRIFYPYHYGEVEQPTDIDRLVEELKEVTDIRIRPME